MKVIRAQAMQRPHKCLGRHYLRPPEPTPTNGKLVASDKNNPPLLSPPPRTRKIPRETHQTTAEPATRQARSHADSRGMISTRRKTTGKLLVDPGVRVHVRQRGRIHGELNITVGAQGTSGVGNELGDSVLTFGDIGGPARIDVALLLYVSHGLIFPHKLGLPLLSATMKRL